MGPNGHYMRFMTRHIGNGYYTIGDPAIYVLKSLSNSNIFKSECINIIGGEIGKTYQFRLFTTHALKIQFNGDKKIKEVGYMKDLYELYTVKENIKPTICFESSEKTIKNGKEIQTEKQAFYFQIIVQGQYSINAVVEPLYEGWVYDDILNKGEYRYYRSAKWSQNKTNVYIMSRMGIINVFQGICHSFPYCSFYDNENIMKNSTQLIMAFNSFI